MIWFTADTHFGHPGILLHQSHRMNAFESVEEMDAQLIDQINSTVGPNDELWHLGDFAWQASRAGHYRQRLNVRTMFVCKGNHDSNSLRRHTSSMWDMVCRKFDMCGETYKIHMCHYPLLSWSALHYGSIHLYGHSHGIYEEKLNEIFPGRRAMDVGVDAMFHLIGKWRPISLVEVVEKLVKNEKPTLSRDEQLVGPFEVDSNEQ
jgi:calcineurin-like phosphoesterase family protein